MEHQGRNIPLVSVVMPAYNAERFIEEAVRSVMIQTFRDWELIVLDDCSTDATAAIVERLAQEDERITLVRNSENMGVALTRNRGFDLCRGEYAALLDSDDVWFPEKLEKQVKLARETGAEILYCSYGIMDEEGRQSCDDFIVPEETDFESFLTRSVISCSTAMLSKKIIEVHRFDITYYHEDLELWYRLLREGRKARGLPEVLAKYRVMEGTRASNKLRSALFRWQIYRGAMGFSWFKSLRLLTCYAVLGFRKYKKHTGS